MNIRPTFEICKIHFNKTIKVNQKKAKMVGFCFDDYGDSYIVIDENKNKKYYDLMDCFYLLPDDEQNNELTFMKKQDCNEEILIEEFILENYRKNV